MCHVYVRVKLNLIYANPESPPKLKMISIQVEFFGLSECGNTNSQEGHLLGEGIY